MADWTVITDAQLDPDAPLTSDLAYAWRDNPIAIAEGASGAPRIRADAMGGSVAGGTLLFGCGGSSVSYAGSGVSSTTQVSDATFRAIADCSVRLYIETNVTSGSGTSLIVYKNASSILTVTSDSDWTSRTVYVSWSPGDIVRIVLINGASGTARVRNIQYRTGSVRSCGGI